jgi:hypothetical protein
MNTKNISIKWTPKLLRGRQVKKSTKWKDAESPLMKTKIQKLSYYFK